MRRIASIPKHFSPRCSVRRPQNNMHMDKTQRGWGIASLIILAASTVGYIIYALSATPAPSGGSVVGLFFGITGFGFMIFAALLGARKRVPVWRLGRAQAWMRGHLWLGF